jgi:predicted ATP-grasp superfamily ATP-dependent carboligase
MPPDRRSIRIHGKAILFAPARLVFPEQGPWRATLATPFHPWQPPAFGDIPAAGTIIEVGQPILTLFAEAADEHDCLRQLRARAAEIIRLCWS